MEIQTDQKVCFVNNHMRHNWFYYLLIAVSSIFIYSFFAIDEKVHCVEYPCPSWLRYLSLSLGLLFSVGTIVAMIRDFQSGSYINLSTKEIVWWSSYPPLDYKKISIKNIQRIEIDPTRDTTTVILFLVTNEKIKLPIECLSSPYSNWCEIILQVDASIKIENK